ncbi:hypothetical protein BT96DRAFT_993309 [Gymnopus androsaceus JB14]|uniref:Amino acid permease/ SLC12A domain-containing protein n=1 Tax=Gymnopus androsaceus JB14 TaxID=1447944 RepID=A0A6A4HQ89_9AGAR|nr:hypothetical protein BT96DRAFT_993309 [Gymnopus androsaceus JB14]
MIAVGGSIGTGLFYRWVQGSALREGGPAALLIAWILMGSSIPGSLSQWGGIMFSNGQVAIPLEITVAATTVQYWTDKIPTAGLITIFWVVIIIASIFGTLGYAEQEFWAGLRIILVCGGGPSDGDYSTYVGGRYWKDPGAFANGFHGVCSVFVTAAFSFTGTELVGLAASETPNPRDSMPGAVSAYIGLSSVFAGSRTMAALAETGYCSSMFCLKSAPIMTIDVDVDRPLLSLLFWPLEAIAYANVAAADRPSVFDWLQAISALSQHCSLGYRFACASEIAVSLRSSLLVVDANFAAAYVSDVLGKFKVILSKSSLSKLQEAIWPIGGVSDPSARATSFFQATLAMPVMLLGGYIWKRTLPHRAHEIDLDSGLKVG